VLYVNEQQDKSTDCHFKGPLFVATPSMTNIIVSAQPPRTSNRGSLKRDSDCAAFVTKCIHCLSSC